MGRGVVALLVSLALGGCSRCHPVDRAPGPVVPLETDLLGLSGLTRDPEGTLWAVAERGGALARIDPSTFAVTTVRLTGVPDESELEAVALAPDGRIVVGTESQRPDRDDDRLLFVRVEGESGEVVSQQTVDYGAWGIRATVNHGLEGLCAAGDSLVVATELVVARGAERWAPVARVDLGTGETVPHLLRLTTPTGKLAAIDCRGTGDAIEALAVERHFGVARLLRFRVPRGEAGDALIPTVVLDLAGRVDPLPNFEGLVWDADGAALLLTDNHYRVDSGEPTRLYFLPARTLGGPSGVSPGP